MVDARCSLDRDRLVGEAWKQCDVAGLGVRNGVVEVSPKQSRGSSEEVEREQDVDDVPGIGRSETGLGLAVCGV